ncbi:kinase-like protein [Leucogyrophana mollusca]|uniref:Kinase-like protein n=1 Tax=Leucogyrophana mollusca TaxID=85980 RepID=A0ACB8BIH5_9AGAM|nr:kinase-like protein [Leucogyrophana mollusca]
MATHYCGHCQKSGPGNLFLHNAKFHPTEDLIRRYTPQPRPRPKISRAPANSSASQLVPSSTFDIWRFNNPSLSTAQISTDDIVNVRNHRTDTPATSSKTLRHAKKFGVLELVYAFRGLSDADRATCDDLVRRIPIFPSLAAYTFTHLKCCTNNLSLLVVLSTSVTEWASQGKLWCLLNHREIKETLLGILKQTEVERHICNTSLGTSSGGAALDIAYVGALVAEIATHAETARDIFALRGEAAQTMVDLLQALTDANVDELDEWYRRRFLDALIRLSRKSGLYPESLVLTNLAILSKEPLYSGGYGAVYKASIQNRLAALKVLKVGNQEPMEILKAFAHEAIVWRHLRHPNCLPFYGVYRAGGDNCLVSPWMENSSLDQYLLTHPAANRMSLLLDIARGLEYLHNSQPTVVHGDLKAANVLITASGRACLADFGFSMTSVSKAVLPTSTELRGKGTLNYCAPELLGTNHFAIMALDQRRCDMYSFGCICYETYTGTHPFADTPDTYQQKLIGKTPPRPSGEEYVIRGLDDKLWDFIMNLWSRNPEARATADQAVSWLLQRSGATEQPYDGAWDVEFIADLTTPTAGYPFVSAP